MRTREGFLLRHHLAFQLLLLTVIAAGITMGSVMLPLGDTLETLWALVRGASVAQNSAAAILVHVRIPRVLSAALTGAALSLCGAAMQGLLRNPLADGSTLGVSSGASLGAVMAISLGITLPAWPIGGTVLMAMLFAFLTLMLILGLSYSFDHSFSTQTIILMGVIFSMFASSLISLFMAFSGDKLRTITFWTMGSLAGTTYVNVLILFIALVLFGGTILFHSRELNAFALGEENALHIGVPVRRVKLTLMVAVSGLIGVCVSVGGTIGFVGLIIPHIVRIIYGPNHLKSLPASIYFGAIFLLLCDLVARTILSPVELPIGVVTSLIGAMVFVFIFRGRKRKGR